MQQKSLGELDGYIEEMVNGQKVVKVFNHEEENMQELPGENEALRKAGNRRPGLAATMIPAVVSISYQLCHCGHFGRYYGTGRMTDRSLANGWCLSGRPAPINQFTQQGNFLAGRPGRRGAGIRGHGPAAGKGRRQGGAGSRRSRWAEEQWAWRREDGTLVPLVGDVRFREVYFWL